MIKFFVLLLYCLVAVCGGVGVQVVKADSTGDSYWEKTKELYYKGKEHGVELVYGDSSETMDLIKDLYERAKANGEEVPQDVAQWAKQDIRKMGSWEYRVEDIKDLDPLHIQRKLNELGAQRWECYWVESVENGKRFYFKKAGKSYLKAVPVGTLLRFFPMGGDE